MANVKCVYKHSPFFKKVQPGDELLRINGKTVHDRLDYMFLLPDKKQRVQLDVLRNGKELSFHAQCGGELYMDFDTYLMDKQRSCRNKCVFCFIDQMPKQMRDTLYYKDDDFRLSLLYGNYVTMTNVSDQDLQRIIDLRISPLNISIHTTNPQLRVKMMSNPRAANIMDILHRFYDVGIRFKGQIVLCPGLNDGQELDRTLSDLSQLYPQLTSVSVVPLGMTKFRDGLYPLVPFTQESAAAAVSQVDGWGQRCLENIGTRLFYVADELYQKAQLPLPDYDYYEDFEQFENGVGMLVSFAREFREELDALSCVDGTIDCSMFTGVAAYDLMQECMRLLREKCPGINCRVYAVENDFFGRQITVAGLLTGQDIVRQLKGRELGEFLLVSEGMLRDDLFLDDVSVQDVASALGVKVVPVACGAADLIQTLVSRAQ